MHITDFGSNPQQKNMFSMNGDLKMPMTSLFDRPQSTRAPVLATYVINLDGSSDRMREFATRMSIVKLPFERVAAYDGRGKPPEHVKAYDAAHAIKYFGRALSGGEVGCYLSHLSCAERFLSSKAEFGLVFEDDVEIRAEDVIILRQVVEWLSGQNTVEWDVVNLGRTPRILSHSIARFETKDLLRSNYFPTTTHALLWSRRGAKKFLSDHDRIIAPVDHYLRQWCCKSGLGLAFGPPLFLPRDVVSEIDIDAGSAFRRTSSRSCYFLLREFVRQFRNHFNASCHFFHQWWNR